MPIHKSIFKNNRIVKKPRTLTNFYTDFGLLSCRKFVYPNHNKYNSMIIKHNNNFKKYKGNILNQLESSDAQISKRNQNVIIYGYIFLFIITDIVIIYYAIIN